MSQNSELHQTPGPSQEKKVEKLRKNSWGAVMIILGAILLVGGLGFALISTSGIFNNPEATQGGAFITITEPKQGDWLDLTWAINIHGEARGLNGEMLVVQALDAMGNVLNQKEIKISNPDTVSEEALPWSVNLYIAAPDGSQGEITAFSVAPADDSRAARDSIEVGYGESVIRDDLVTVEDHLWKLATLNERALLQNTGLSLSFENFSAAGSGGCNNYRTNFERSGPNLNFGFVTSTAKDCESPAGIMSQEAAYFDALEQAVSYRIENQQLQIFDREGALRLAFDPVILGIITDHEEIRLPQNAVIIISLRDNLQPDLDTIPIARHVLSGENRFPIPFELIYNPKQIIDQHVYVIEVQIEDSSGNLLYRNPSTHDVITGESPSRVEVIVERAQ